MDKMSIYWLVNMAVLIFFYKKFEIVLQKRYRNGEDK